MSKNFQPPTLEKISEPVVAAATKPSNNDIVVDNVPTSTKEVTITSIYIKRINDFVDLLNGKRGFDSVDERDAAQNDFVDLIPLFFDLKQVDCATCLDHLIQVIKENPVPFSHENVLEPYWAMKKKRNAMVTEFYFNFMSFIVGYANNLSRRTRFLAGYDVAKLGSQLSPSQGERLHIYLYG